MWHFLRLLHRKRWILHLLRQRVCFALNKERPCRDKQEGDKRKIMPSVESQKQKGKEKYGTARTSVCSSDLRHKTSTKDVLLCSFPLLCLSGSYVHQIPQPHWVRGTVEVCAGGTAVEPGGGFQLPLLLLHRCLLAHMSCHMFPAWPPPEGAKSVFAHNLHSLTRPSLPLTGAHGVAFMKHSRGITLLFLLLFFFYFSLNCCVTFVSTSAFISIFQV